MVRINKHGETDSEELLSSIQAIRGRAFNTLFATIRSAEERRTFSSSEIASKAGHRLDETIAVTRGGSKCGLSENNAPASNSRNVGLAGPVTGAEDDTEAVGIESDDGVTDLANFPFVEKADDDGVVVTVVELTGC